MLLETFIISARAIADASAVSFTRTMISLEIGGITMRNVWGKMMPNSD